MSEKARGPSNTFYFLRSNIIWQQKLYLVDQYRAILNRKSSICNILQKTADGLANAFARDQKSPEDLIYELFKIPNKNEASVGKLLSVSIFWSLQISITTLGSEKLWTSRQRP